MSDAASSLRAKQKPLKDKYRSDPSSALVTLSSKGSLDATSLTCSLNPSTSAAAKKVAGLHSAAGGPGFDASGELCSGDMLLESLVACFGVTIRAVATAMAIPLSGGEVTVEGDLDFRGTMGIKDENGGEVAVGFREIRLGVRLEVDEDGDEMKGKVDKLVQLAERYCVVLQTIRKGVEVKTSTDVVGTKSAGGDGGGQVGGDGNGEVEKTLSNEEVLRVN